MGASVSPVITNIFLNNFEIKILNTCPSTYKPKFYRLYLDNIFLLLDNENQVKLYLDFIISKHAQINFPFEGENKNALSFLDVAVKRNYCIFTSSIFRKHTFSFFGLITNYFNNIVMKYKISSIITLLHRAYDVSSNYALYQ